MRNTHPVLTLDSVYPTATYLPYLQRRGSARVSAACCRDMKAIYGDRPAAAALLPYLAYVRLYGRGDRCCGRARWADSGVMWRHEHSLRL